MRNYLRYITYREQVPFDTQGTEVPKEKRKKMKEKLKLTNNQRNHPGPLSQRFQARNFLAKQKISKSSISIISTTRNSKLETELRFLDNINVNR